MGHPLAATVRHAAILLLAAFACLLGACSVVDVARGTAPLERGAKWALLPMSNHTESPQAGLRAESIAEVLLRARGVGSLARYPASLNPDALLEPADRKLQGEALKWARGENARYAVYGAVDEWRYKVGIDGEPAVGLALHVMDLKTGEVVWSAAGARSGWSREALSAVAQKLMRELLDGAPLQ